MNTRFSVTNPLCFRRWEETRRKRKKGVHLQCTKSSFVFGIQQVYSKATELNLFPFVGGPSRCSKAVERRRCETTSSLMTWRRLSLSHTLCMSSSEGVWTLLRRLWRGFTVLQDHKVLRLCLLVFVSPECILFQTSG